jgi:mono/diheme cytochrome c family protein
MTIKIGLTVLAALACAAPVAAAPKERMISAGEQIARRNCAECHALEPGQASPLADAPTFAVLRSRYDRAEMAEILDERMHTFHPRMPRLDLDVDETAEFLRWWDGLTPATRPATK